MTRERETVMRRWSDPKVVRVGHVTSGRRCPLRTVISGEEGWPWEGEAIIEVLVRNSELITVDCPIKRFPSGRCPVIPQG